MKRGENHQPFASPEEALKHHGVKGQRWGVRKEEDTGHGARGIISEGSKTSVALNDKSKAYMSAAEKLDTEGHALSSEQKAANLKANRERFRQKFEASEGPDAKGRIPVVEKQDPGLLTKGKAKWNSLSKEQKENLAIIGVTGAVLAAYTGYAVYEGKRAPALAKLADEAYEAKKFAKPGQLITTTEFGKRIGLSQDATWSVDNFFRPESFSRPAFELPEGHTFRRISSAAEKTFSAGTYCSSNEDDFNRYASVLGVFNKHEITFKSTAPIKVPALTEVLETLKEETISRRRKIPGRENFDMDETDVLHAYKSISHDQWKGDNATDLIKALTKKGYGAIVDEMDSGVFSDHPLVVFSDKVTPKQARRLTDKDISHAISNLREINNPPGRKLGPKTQFGGIDPAADPGAFVKRFILDDPVAA